MGLVALWREALLAKAVLRGETKGCRHHPQLDRFRASPAPLHSINTYLAGVYQESVARSCRFSKGKVGPIRASIVLPVTSGQPAFEWAHLLAKLAVRDRRRLQQLAGTSTIDCHPLFRVSSGPVACWERP